MDVSVPKLVPYLTAWAATTGGVLALFAYAETVVREETRDTVTRWLTSKPGTQLKEWPSTFSAVFDHVFGERHVSWRCFRVSAFVSIVCCGIMTLIVGSATGDTLKYVGYDHDINKMLVNIVVSVMFVALLNVFPDYVSLLETRLLVRVMTNASPWVIALILALDAVLTMIIFVTGLWVFYYAMGLFALFVPNGEYAWPQPPVIYYLIRNAATFWDGKLGSFMGIYLYTTFATSVWLWLFAIIGLVVSLLSGFKSALRRTARVLDVEKKPLRSMGFLCALLVTLVFAILPFVR
jgi:hypothetical protein